MVLSHSDNLLPSGDKESKDINCKNQYGNKDIENLLKESEKNGSNIKWIPYEQLKGITFIAKGGFEEVYSSQWLSGNAGQTVHVALKSLKAFAHAPDIDYLNEISQYVKLFRRSCERRPLMCCFGVTQDPLSETYYMVMPYASRGDLCRYLKSNFNSLDWNAKLSILYDICQCLVVIHAQKLVHCDLHSGNVLLFSDYSSVSDLGLCRPAAAAAAIAANNDRPPLFGILPYIAPEVLRGRAHTFAADIYSFAMLMWELTTGYRPFRQQSQEGSLALHIIDGLRPEILPWTPKCYEALMRKCWDPDLIKRPSAEELGATIRSWLNDLNTDRLADFSNCDVRDIDEDPLTMLHQDEDECNFGYETVINDLIVDIV